MKYGHFETLRPVCCVCREPEKSHALEIASVEGESEGLLIEGVLQCSNTVCRREYPVIDGIPILIREIRRYVSDHLLELIGRHDLSASLESLIGDCCGPDSSYDNLRRQLSFYGFDHWADLEPSSQVAEGSGSALSLLERSLSLAGDVPSGPSLDIGCAAGRTTFALGRETGGPTLGVDLSFSMLRLAQRVLQDGTVLYPLRRIGVAYERQTFQIEDLAQDVDFWVCDASSLPFEEGTFGVVCSLNVLDCVPDPMAALHSLGRVLAPGGKALLSTPYDWSSEATAMESWIGGHSQRSPESGAPEPALRKLIEGDSEGTPALRILAEDEAVPWRIRLHDRSEVHYRAHVLAAEAAVRGAGD